MSNCNNIWWPVFDSYPLFWIYIFYWMLFIISASLYWMTRTSSRTTATRRSSLFWRASVSIIGANQIRTCLAVMNRDPIANRVANPDAIKSGSRIRLIFFTIKKIPVRRKNLKEGVFYFFHWTAVLLSRPFFGRLRKSEVPEPNPALTKLGRLRLQAKKGGSGSIH